MTEDVAPVSPELIGEWSAVLTTRNGLRLHVRPAAPEDKEILRRFLLALAPEDLRFRFLTPLKRPSESLLHSLVDVDHIRTEDFLAFHIEGTQRRLIASAMVAASDDRASAEVAIAVLPAFKGRGVGWTLLDFVAEDAAARGIAELHSIESRDNRVTIGLEKEMGFTARSDPDDPTLTILSKRLKRGQ